jgi:hypothetical protein
MSCTVAAMISPAHKEKTIFMNQLRIKDELNSQFGCFVGAHGCAPSAEVRDFVES